MRITHLPSKIIVQCQSNESQHRNKNIAQQILKSKLYELEIIKEEEKIKNRIIDHKYVGKPNRIICKCATISDGKDHRTNYEESNVNSILDGK